MMMKLKMVSIGGDHDGGEGYPNPPGKRDVTPPGKPLQLKEQIQIPTVFL